MKIWTRRVILGGYGEKHAIRILAQGDQHNEDIGHVAGAQDAFLRALGRAPAGSGAFLLGDTWTFASTRSRKAILKSFQDATDDAQDSVDGFVAEMTTALRKKLEPLKEKIWGLVEGNHSWQFRDGTTPDSRLAELLGCPHSDGLLILCLSLSSINRPRARASLNVVCHHGTSAAQTIGGDVNSVIKHSGFFSNGDIVLEGHTHGLSVSPEVRLQIVHGTSGPPALRHMHVWNARCGSAKGSYRPGRAGYEEKRFFKPAMLGHVEFDVWLERHSHGGREFVSARVDGRVQPYHNPAMSNLWAEDHATTSSANRVD